MTFRLINHWLVVYHVSGVFEVENMAGCDRMRGVIGQEQEPDGSLLERSEPPWHLVWNRGGGEGGGEGEENILVRDPKWIPCT